MGKFGAPARPARLVIAALVMATAAPAVVACSPSQSTASATAAHLPDIIQLSEAMLVDQSSFPPGLDPPLNFNGPYFEIARQPGPTEPRQCEPLLHGPDRTDAAAPPRAVQGIYVGYTDHLPRHIGSRYYRVTIGVPLERPNFTDLVDMCTTIKTETATYTYELLPTDVVLGASATSVWRRETGRFITDTVEVFGYARGVFVKAYIGTVHDNPTAHEISRDDVLAVIKMFTDQVAKLNTA